MKIKGIRVAGYDDPYERQRRRRLRGHLPEAPTHRRDRGFATWLRPLRDDVDIVMVHNPALLPDALKELDEENPPSRSLFLVGHTHHQELTRSAGATIINAGTVGAGGTGNLKEHSKVGIARVTYGRRRASPRSRSIWSRSTPARATRPRGASGWTNRPCPEAPGRRRLRASGRCGVHRRAGEARHRHRGLRPRVDRALRAGRRRAAPGPRPTARRIEHFGPPPSPASAPRGSSTSW